MLSVLEHGFSHFSGDPGKSGKKIVELRAAFKIREQRFNRHSRARNTQAPPLTRITIALDGGQEDQSSMFTDTGSHPIAKFEL
jgi:hypothetical protein